MDEVYWGVFALNDGVMRPLCDERVCAPEQVELPLETGQADVAGAGTGWQLADRLAVKPSRYWSDMLPDARDLLALALPRWLAGEVLDAADAQPIYLRDKVATPKAQR